MKPRNFIALSCLAGLTILSAGIAMELLTKSKSVSRELIPISPIPSGVVGPIQLSSAHFSSDSKYLFLTFTPDLKPFDADDLTLTIRFYEKSPSGLVETSFIPSIDWSLWKIPVLGDKPRKLKVSSLGAFDQMTIEIQYKSTVIETRSFLCKKGAKR